MNQDILERVPLLKSPEQFGFPTQVLSDNPPVMLVKNLLTPMECQHIINLAKTKLKSSTMIVDNKEVVNQGRSSRSAFITTNGDLPFNDAVIHRFLTRLSTMTNMPVTHFEGMKVVNYQKGQQYLAHHDYFSHHDNFTKGCGDRIMTFFVYLNTLPPEDGGSTSFPRLNLKVQPQAGSATFWLNMDFEGNYHENTLHAGDMVTGDDEKWGINIWIRERSYFTK